MSPRPTRSTRPAPSDPLVAWRRAKLLRGGFEHELAAALAEDRTVDLHAVLNLVDQGCPPEIAARIHAPLDDLTRAVMRRPPWT